MDMDENLYDAPLDHPWPENFLNLDLLLRFDFFADR
jgi:hypothetical protein